MSDLVDAGRSAPAGVSRRVLRVVLLFALGVAFAASTDQRGLALDRTTLLLWICALLAIVTITTPGRFTRLLLDWLPFGIALVAYDLSRGAADTLGMPIQRSSIASVDKLLFFGHVPSVWLQAHIDQTRAHPQWWQAIVTLIYSSHLVVPFVIAGYLWWRSRERWVRWVRRFIILTAAGLLTYVLVPAEPPWLASKHGAIGPVHRVTTRGWTVLHVRFAGQLLERGQATVNSVAAFPSLHAAFSMLACVYFWPTSRWPLRIVLLAYPLAMGFVLVLGGEHYVTDILAGWLYVAGACWVANRWEQRHRAGRAEAPTLAPVSVED